MSSGQSAICRDCDVEAQHKLENGKPRELVCPQCGATDSYESFVRMISRTSIAQIQDKNNRMFRGMKNVSYRPGRVEIPKSKFRLG